jgi:excisionase family DNA binding protein
MFTLSPSFKSKLPVDYSEEALLELWFSLSEKERAEQFLDTRTAAQRTAISQRTIRIWIESGQIQAIKIGKKHQVHASSLKEFISHHAFNR